jgi:hypothetical protein
MNSLKSLAMNCGPLSEMIRGFNAGIPLLGPFQNVLESRRSVLEELLLPAVKHRRLEPPSVQLAVPKTPPMGRKHKLSTTPVELIVWKSFQQSAIPLRRDSRAF